MIKWNDNEVSEPVTRVPTNFEFATNDDTPALIVLRSAVSNELTRIYGHGPWSSVSQEGVARDRARFERQFIVRDKERIIATFKLQTRKPWAIDRSYFSKVKTPIYLTDMSVHPSHQRQGMGRECLEEAARAVREWPADAIFLDAYDAPAGAGAFYARCGFREVGRVVYRKTPLVYFEQLLGTGSTTNAMP